MSWLLLSWPGIAEHVRYMIRCFIPLLLFLLQKLREHIALDKAEKRRANDEMLKMYLALGGAAAAAKQPSIGSEQEELDDALDERVSDRKAVQGFYRMEDIISVEEVGGKALVLLTVHRQLTSFLVFFLWRRSSIFCTR